MNALIPFYIIAAVLSLVLTFACSLGILGFILVLVGSFIGILVLVILVCFISTLFVKKEEQIDKISPYFSAVTYFFMGIICGVMRIRIKTVGFEKLPSDSFLLVGNHRSGFDPIVTGKALAGRKLTFVAKPEILALPFVGTIIHKSGFLAIDRESARAAIATINRAAAFIKEDGIPVGIYPEGTRNRGEGLLEFRSGAFKIAKKANCPIAVVAVEGTENIMKNYPLRHTDVTITLCSVIPLSAVEESNTKTLGDMAYASLLNQISAK